MNALHVETALAGIPPLNNKQVVGVFILSRYCALIACELLDNYARKLPRGGSLKRLPLKLRRVRVRGASFSFFHACSALREI